jgi:hypothetical protein
MMQIHRSSLTSLGTKRRVMIIGSRFRDNEESCGRLWLGMRLEGNYTHAAQRKTLEIRK